MTMTSREKTANDKFSCTERERAIFEAGIKLATVYHQFVGTPVNIDTVKQLEDTISRTIEVQPYVECAKIKIDRDSFVSDGDTYSYVSLTGDMIDAKVVIALGDSRVTAEMRYDEDLEYPLMYVSKIE
ncbi:dihydroneopterin aldolase family protein [Methanomassiliicoccales archaeon LGM-RCC1]|nr:dihydroneopterin aldolase family protein [Methanomassiliicoccales archaeon LGM-RCC1]